MASSRSGKVNVRIHRGGVTRAVEPTIRPVEASMSEPRRAQGKRVLPGATPAPSPKNSELRSKLAVANEETKTLRDAAEALCRTVLARVADPPTREAAESLLRHLHPEKSP